MFDNIIIGAGASGLLASILLAKKSQKVTILEKEKKVAKKLRATGNGKCNITNLNISTINFYSNTPQFIKDFILPYKDIKKVFLEIGILFLEKDDGKVFPLSEEANSVADILEYEAKRLGVNIILECEVNNIQKGFVLQTSKGVFNTKNLILATGHKAGFRLGSSDSGVQFAKKLGHFVYEPYPSLVQLITKENFSKCSGVKVKVKLSLFSNNKLIKTTKGDLLFRDYGLSGLAVLDISQGIAKRLKEYEYIELIIDFFENYSKENLKQILTSIKSEKDINLALRTILPTKIISIILQKADIKVKFINQLNTKEINKLIYVLKNFKVEIVDTKEFKNAEVVSGGVSLFDIDINKMESKKIPNLYFLGEMIDIDGDRGGYNLHFAWSSAIKLALNKNK
jgi:predicted Rossmann fold flavoprotein